MVSFGKEIHRRCKRKQKGNEMYNKEIIDRLIYLIEQSGGTGNKEVIAITIAKAFNLKKKGAVYCGKQFAIRFLSTKSKSESVSNTVMSLKHIKNFDSIPLFVCVVGPEQNYIRLSNATFIKKVSHSSKNLSESNIVGNVNYSDIMRAYEGIPNIPENFERLFGKHSQIDFSKNLSRIVEETKKIVPTGKSFIPTDQQRKIILDAPRRAYDFIMSGAYNELKSELDSRAQSVKRDLILVEKAYSHDVKLRGNLIEHFIKLEDDKQKEKLRNQLKNNALFRNL